MPSTTLVAPWFELGAWRPVHWWLALTVLAAVGWVLFSGQHRRQWADRDLAWLLWHWFTGGRLEPSRTYLPFDETSTRRARLARRTVVGAARTSVPAALVAAEYVRSGAPRGTGIPTVAAAGVVGSVALAAATWAIVYVAVRVAHYLQWVMPLHRAVHELAGWDETKRPWRYIRVPRNRAEGGKGVIVHVAPNFQLVDNRMSKVVDVVRAKIDLGDATVNWVPAGRHSYVQFRPRARMPERAMFSDPEIRHLVDQQKSSAPVIGLTRGGGKVAVDLDTESPHILLSAGTGGGKSSTAATIVAQLMRNGADVTVLDIKRHSHRQLAGLPGVTYARDLGEIHRVLVELGAEGHRRNKLWDDVDLDEEGPVFRRHVILCEEMNATMAVLKQWWKNHKEPGDPPESPAVRSLAQILFMGRAVRIHVLATAQMATARDMGGPELRENFATRILARHTKRAWEMLVPECGYQPATRHPGRLFVCIGGVATETQGIYMTPQEARAWARDRREQPELDVASVAGRDTPVSLVKQPATVAAPAFDGVEPVSLPQASTDLGRRIVALSYDALRKAAERDLEFPRPVGRRGNARLYPPAELQRWELNRPRAVVVGRGSETPDMERNEVDGVDRMEAREKV